MKSEWEGEIEEDVRLNDGDNEKVILKRDPSKDGNVFGGSSLYFNYSTTSGSSTLTLQKDPSLKDMSYYIESLITVNPGSHLIMNLDSIGGQGLFKLYNSGGIIVSGSTVDINNVNTFIVDVGSGRSVTVEDGGTLNINNVDNLINISSDTGAMGIQNLNSTLHINADVYNYNKDTTQGAGYFRQTGENATIGGSFYNAGFNSGSGGRQDALVHINGGTFTVTGEFENGKNISDASSDYYGVGNVKADNGALITVNGNFISDAQGDSFLLSDTRSSVDLNNANLVLKGKFDVSRTDIYLKKYS